MDIYELRKQVEENNVETNAKLKEYLETIDIFSVIYPHGENLLHFACGAGNVEICEYLIKNKKIHPNIYNSRGVVPMIYASLRDQYEVIKFLIDMNADPMIRSGFSGLFPHQSTKSKKIQNLLLEHKNTIVPIDYENGLKLIVGFTQYNSYKYRMHKYFLSFVSNEILKNAGLSPIEGMRESNEIKELILQGFDKLLERYDEIYEDYIQSLSTTDNDKTCLVCKKTNFETKLLRCSKCKKVYFCDKTCQRRGHLLHNFDCSRVSQY